VAHCFNPAGLSRDTLRRLRDGWNHTKDRPAIKVLINEGDVVPYFDEGYLPGTQFVRISSGTEKLSFNFNFPMFLNFIAKGYEAHIHHFAGRANTKFNDVPLEEINQAPARHVLNDIRWTVSWLLFPLQYLSLFTTIIERKISRFYEKHKLLIFLGLFLLSTALAFTLVITGVAPILFGLATSYLLLLNLPLSLLAVEAIATALVSSLLIVSPLVTALAASYLIPLAKRALIGICSGAAVVVGVTLGAIGGLIRLGINKLFEPKSDTNLIQEKTKTSHDTMMRSLGASEDSLKQEDDCEMDIKHVDYLSMSKITKNKMNADIYEMTFTESLTQSF
jgi:hypothetical protein